MSNYKLNLSEHQQEEIFTNISNFISDFEIEHYEDVRDIPSGHLEEEMVSLIKIVFGN